MSAPVCAFGVARRAYVVDTDTNGTVILYLVPDGSSMLFE